MDKTIKAVDIFFRFFLAALSSLLGMLYVPVLLMVLFNVIDYVTGLVASKYRDNGKISSYKSIRGIYKKIGMWLLVIVGAGLDQLILYSVGMFGIDISFKFAIACVVTVWICCNEIISILENMLDIGIALPPFLMPLVKYIKKQSEDKVKFDDEIEGGTK